MKKLIYKIINKETNKADFYVYKITPKTKEPGYQLFFKTGYVDDVQYIHEDGVIESLIECQFDSKEHFDNMYYVKKI